MIGEAVNGCLPYNARLFVLIDLFSQVVVTSASRTPFVQ